MDALAIAIGNAHGNYKATPKLRFDILAQVAEDTRTPCAPRRTGISRRFRRCARQGSKRSILHGHFDSVEQTVRALTTPVLSAVTTICKGQRCRGV